MIETLLSVLCKRWIGRHPDLDDALDIFDRLNCRFGLDRQAWQAVVAAFMRAEDVDPDSDPWH